VTPVPTENGQGPGAASTLGGWAFAISKASPSATAAWNFIKLAESPQNQLNNRHLSGFVPPDTSVGELKPFVDFAPPFQGRVSTSTSSSTGSPCPTTPTSLVYARALNTVHRRFRQNPGASISSSWPRYPASSHQSSGPQDRIARLTQEEPDVRVKLATLVQPLPATPLPDRPPGVSLPDGARVRPDCILSSA